MKYKETEIYKKFAGKLVGNDFMKEKVCETLSFMSSEIIDLVTKKFWFMASIDDAYAFTFSGNDLADQHLIFLSDDLLNQDEEQIRYTIAHEIGHVALGHRNSVVVKQSKEEVRNQEVAADQFAKSYI